MTGMRWRATRLALAWSLGSVAIALIGVVLYLLVVDVLLYDGHCPGSLLPFLGDPGPRACEFTEYLDGHGLFTLQVLVATVWPIALLFVVVAVAFGVARDRQRAGLFDQHERDDSA
jgi:hypothetical protein